MRRGSVRWRGASGPAPPPSRALRFSHELLRQIAAVQPLAVAAARLVVERLVAVAGLLPRADRADLLRAFAALGFAQEIGRLRGRGWLAGAISVFSPIASVTAAASCFS